jgi:hypothetical protein
MKSVIGVSALSIITILGKSLASGLHSVKVPLNAVPNYDVEVNAKTNYDGDGFCGFISKNYPEINDAEPLALLV